MGANEDVDLPLLNPLDNFFLLLCRAKAAKHLDHDGEGGESAFESFVMLESQHSSRCEHGNLPVVLNSFEGGTHGNFGFAIANVTAEQAIHRHCGFHVLLDI